MAEWLRFKVQISHLSTAEVKIEVFLAVEFCWFGQYQYIIESNVWYGICDLLAFKSIH